MKNIAIGANYSLSVSPSADYPDLGKSLTDGKISPSSKHDAVAHEMNMKDFWVGFSGQRGKSVTIDVELDEVKDDITEFELFFLQETASGIAVPGRVDVFFSQGDEYTYMGSHLFPKELFSQTKYTARLTAAEPIKASRVRFCITDISSELILLEEIRICTPGDDETEPGWFAPDDTDYNAEPSFWDESEPDYNSYGNMLLGVPYHISTEVPLDPAQQTDYFNTREMYGHLTDGKHAARPIYTDPEWYHCSGGFVREISFCLEHITAVDSVRIGFLSSTPLWIEVPVWMSVSISENGKEWQTVFREKDVFVEEGEEIVHIAGKFDREYKARYISIKFRLVAHCWVDQIEIYGRKNTAEAASPAARAGDSPTPNVFPKPDDFGGIHDTILAYVNKSAERATTAEKYLPQFAYYKDGKAVGRLMDSALFLPDSSFRHKKDMLTKAQWEYFVSIEFIDGGNMNGLNEAAGTARRDLNDPNFRVGVFMPLAFPYTFVEDFGEIDGKKMDMTDREDRKRTLRWFVDYQKMIFDSKGYENIVLKGFYWHEEGIDTSDSDITEIALDITDYIRSLGLFTCWIPYYLSGGFEVWKDFGIDLALMQPNYAFDLRVPKSRLYDSIPLSKKYGLGVEIEIDSLGHDYVDRLNEYFYACAQCGAMKDTVHMYYAGGMPGAIYHSYTSEDKHYRSMYDSVGRFAAGTFGENTNGPEPEMIKTKKDTKAAGRLGGEPVDFVKYIDISSSPKHGMVRIEPDGRYEYTPAEGYTGEDSFEVRYYYGFMYSEATRITVEVIE